MLLKYNVRMNENNAPTIKITARIIKLQQFLLKSRQI